MRLAGRSRRPPGPATRRPPRGGSGTSPDLSAPVSDLTPWIDPNFVLARGAICDPVQFYAGPPGPRPVPERVLGHADRGPPGGLRPPRGPAPAGAVHRAQDQLRPRWRRLLRPGPARGHHRGQPAPRAGLLGARRD